MSRRQQGGRTTTITSNEAHADGKEERTKKGAEMEMRKAFFMQVSHIHGVDQSAVIVFVLGMICVQPLLQVHKLHDG